MLKTFSFIVERGIDQATSGGAGEAVGRRVLQNPMPIPMPEQLGSMRV